MDAKKTMTLSAEKHEAEDHFHGLFKEAMPELDGPIQAARAAGIPWSKILQLLAQFGPGFVAALQAIIAGINSTPPVAEEAEKPEKARLKGPEAKAPEKVEEAEEPEKAEKAEKPHAAHGHHGHHGGHGHHAKDK